MFADVTDNERSESLASYDGMEESKHAEITIFDLTTITNATDQFSDANKLGEGGFGSVYKVTTPKYD